MPSTREMIAKVFALPDEAGLGDNGSFDSITILLFTIISRSRNGWKRPENRGAGVRPPPISCPELARPPSRADAFTGRAGRGRRIGYSLSFREVLIIRLEAAQALVDTIEYISDHRS
jgi:hypothetical protein